MGVVTVTNNRKDIVKINEFLWEMRPERNKSGVYYCLTSQYKPVLFRYIHSSRPMQVVYHS